MTTLTIITDDADRARHQANVDAFLADARNRDVFAAFVDAPFDEGITDDEIIDAVAIDLGITRSDAIERLAQIDFEAARAAIAEPA